MSSPKYYRVRQIIEIYGLSESTVWRLIRKKAIKSRVLNPNEKRPIRLICAKSVDDYINKNSVDG